MLSKKKNKFIVFQISVEGLHREFLRAGSDVMQAFTFYASDDKLDNRGHMMGNYSINSLIILRID